MRLEAMRLEQLDLPLVIGGEEVRTGETFEAVMPHDKKHVLATVHKGNAGHVEQAIKAAGDAWEDWHRTAAGRIAPRSSSARPSSSPVRGARHSTRRRCSGQSKTAIRPRSTRPAS